jgi:predicted  nucleic acid-binding Zn-ribbon protein
MSCKLVIKNPEIASAIGSSFETIEDFQSAFYNEYIVKSTAIPISMKDSLVFQEEQKIKEEQEAGTRKKGKARRAITDLQFLKFKVKEDNSVEVSVRLPSLLFSAEFPTSILDPLDFTIEQLDKLKEQQKENLEKAREAKEKGGRPPEIKEIKPIESGIATARPYLITIPAKQEDGNLVPNLDILIGLWMGNYFSVTANPESLKGVFKDLPKIIAKTRDRVREEIERAKALAEKSMEEDLFTQDTADALEKIRTTIFESKTFIESIFGPEGLYDMYLSLAQDTLSPQDLKSIQSAVKMIDSTIAEFTKMFDDNNVEASSDLFQFKKYRLFEEVSKDKNSPYYGKIHQEIEALFNEIENGTVFPTSSIPSSRMTVIKSIGKLREEDYTSVDNAVVAKNILMTLINSDSTRNYRVRAIFDSSDNVQERLLSKTGKEASKPLPEKYVNNEGVVFVFEVEEKGEWKPVYLKATNPSAKVKLSDMASEGKIAENYSITTDPTQAYNLTYELEKEDGTVETKNSPVLTFNNNFITFSTTTDKEKTRYKKAYIDGIKAGKIIVHPISKSLQSSNRSESARKKGFTFSDINVRRDEGSAGIVYLGDVFAERGSLPEDMAQEVIGLLNHTYESKEEIQAVISYLNSIIGLGNFITPTSNTFDPLNNVNITSRNVQFSIEKDPSNPEKLKIGTKVYRLKNPNTGKFEFIKNPKTQIYTSGDLVVEGGIRGARIRVPYDPYDEAVVSYDQRYKIEGGKLVKVDWSTTEQQEFLLDNLSTSYNKMSTDEGVMYVKADKVAFISIDPIVYQKEEKAPTPETPVTPVEPSVAPIAQPVYKMAAVGEFMSISGLKNQITELNSQGSTDKNAIPTLDPSTTFTEIEEQLMSLAISQLSKNVVVKFVSKIDDPIGPRGEGTFIAVQEKEDGSNFTYDELGRAPKEGVSPNEKTTVNKVILIDTNSFNDIEFRKKFLKVGFMEEVIHSLSLDQLRREEVKNSQEYKRLEKARTDLIKEVTSGNLELTEEERIVFDYHTGSMEEFLIAPFQPVMQDILNRSKVKYSTAGKKEGWKSLLDYLESNIKDLFNIIANLMRKSNPSLEESITIDSLGIILNQINVKQATPKKAVKKKEEREEQAEALSATVGEEIPALTSTETTEPAKPSPITGIAEKNSVNIPAKFDVFTPTIDSTKDLKTTRKTRSLIPALSVRFSTKESTKEMFKDLSVLKNAADFLDITLSNVLWNYNVFSNLVQNELEISTLTNIVREQLKAEITFSKDESRINYLTYLEENLENIWFKYSGLLQEINIDSEGLLKSIEAQGITDVDDISVDAEESINNDEEGGGSDPTSKYRDRTEQEKSSFEVGGRLTKIFLRTIPKIQGFEMQESKVETGEVDENGNPIYQTVVTKRPILYRDEFGNFVPVELTALWNTISDKVAGSLTVEEMVQKLSTGYNKFKEVELVVSLLNSLNADISNVFLLKDFEKSFQLFYVPTLLTELIPIDDRTETNANFTAMSYESNRLDALNIQAILTSSLRSYFSKDFTVGPYLDYVKVMEDMKSKIDLSILSNNARLIQAKKEVKDYWASVGIEFPKDAPAELKRDFESNLLEFTKSLYKKFHYLKKDDVKPKDLGLIDFDLFSFVKTTTTIGKKKYSGNSRPVYSMMEILAEVLPYATSNMTKNAEGKNQSNLHLASTYLVTAELLNRIPNAKANNDQNQLRYIFNSVPRLGNPIVKHSWMFKKLLSGRKINVVNISGVLGTQTDTGRDIGKNTINLNFTEYLRQELHLFFKRGLVENLRAETASTSFGAYVQSVTANPETPIAFGKSVVQQAQAIYFEYLKGEVERIYKEFQYENTRDENTPTYFEGNPYNNYKFDFTYLANVLNPILKQDLISRIEKAANSGTSLEDLIKEISNPSTIETFNQDVAAYKDELVSEFKDTVRRFSGFEVSLRHPSFAISTVEDSVEKIRPEAGQAGFDALVDFFVMNRQILSIENSILFNGEIGIFNNFYKRAKSPISNGTPVVISGRTAEYIKNSAQGVTFSEALEGKRPEYYSDPSKVDTFIIEDDIVETDPEILSKQKEAIIEAVKNTSKFFNKTISQEELDALAEDAVKGQYKITASDGDGYVHPDFYRMILIGVNSWSDAREEGFQYLAVKARKSKGQILTQEDQELYDYVEEKIKREGMYFDFPKVKFQYAGPSKSVSYVVEEKDGQTTKTRVENKFVVQPESLDKFSLMPLFPELVEGTRAQVLLDVMTKNNIGYVKFRTGTKTFQYEGNSIQELTSDMTPKGVHSNQTIFLKEQVKTSEGAYDENLLGTQVRKLLISNLSLNGKFMEDISENYEKWKSSQREYANLARRELLIELGADPSEIDNTSTAANIEIDVNKLVDLVKKEFLRRDLPASITQYFDREFDLSDEGLRDYLESSISPKIIENLLYSLLKNRIVKPKIKGAAFVVTSNSLFTTLDGDGNITRDLQTYEPVIEGGKVTRIRRAQCKVTLQGDYLNLLNLPEVKDLGGDLNALNEMLKDPAFREKNKKSLTIFTSRIPNQGYNSDDALEVVQFLPPYITNSLIPYPAIVDKTGMDFDYDKLPAITASIDKSGNYITSENTDEAISKMSEEEFSEYLDGIKAEIAAVKEERKGIKEKIKNVNEFIQEIKTSKEAAKEIVTEIKNEITSLDMEIYTLSFEIEEETKKLTDLEKELGALKAKSYKIVNGKKVPTKNEADLTPTLEKIKEINSTIKKLKSERSSKKLEISNLGNNLKSAFETINATYAGISQEIETKKAFYDEINNSRSVTNELYDKLNLALRSRRRDAIYSNEMLESSSEIILNPINFYRLIRPNTTELINKSVIRVLRKIYNLGNEMSDREVVRAVNPSALNTEVFNPSMHYKKFISVKLKDNLGISAVNNVYYSLMQEIDYKLNKYYTLYGIDLKFTLPLIPPSDLEDSSISNPFFANSTIDKLEVINQFINIFVDAASDDTAGYTNLKKENLGFGIFQILNGATLDNVLSILHQPAIYKYDYLKDYYLNIGYTANNAKKTALSILIGFDLMTDLLDEVGRPVGETFISNTKLWETLSSIPIPDSFDPVELYEGMDNPLNHTITSETLGELSLSEKQALVYYVKGLEEAEIFRKGQSVTNFDKSPYNSLNLNEIRNASIVEIEETGLIEVDSIMRIFNKSVISHLDIIEDFRGLSKRLFAIKSYAPFKDIVAEMGVSVSSSQREKFSNAIDNDFLMYIIQNFTPGFNQEKINYLKELAKPNGLMMRWSELIKKYNLQDTKLATKLYPNSTRNGSVNPALFMGMDNDVKEFDYIRNEIEVMLAQEGTDERSTELRQFAQDLLDLGFFQTGYNTSPIYLLKVFPAFYLQQFEEAYRTFDKLSKEEKSNHIFKFRHKFLRNRVLQFGKFFTNEYGGKYDSLKNSASMDGLRMLNYIYTEQDKTEQDQTKTKVETISRVKTDRIIRMNARIALNKKLALSEIGEIKNIEEAMGITSESLYSQLGSKTKSENVIIDDKAGRKPAEKSGVKEADRPIIAYRTKGNSLLEALEQDNAIGNPWSHLGSGQNANVKFEEEQTTGYKNRTIKNASADATIAIAVDFNSAGEKLTKSSVLNQGKKYISLDANNLTVTEERVDRIVKELNSVNAKTLNIAGNGIYTMKGKYTQQQVDDFTYELLNRVINSPNLKTKIESIRSGGQTGFDEAGTKAGIKLGLPTLTLAPKGWTFRNINGKDISNEEQFKARFNIETKNQYGLYKTNTVQEAVQEFMSWMTGEKHTDILQEYRSAIISQIPNLKGKKIVYYQELGQPSHATALDYLINKYDWSKTGTKPLTFETLDRFSFKEKQTILTNFYSQYGDKFGSVEEMINYINESLQNPEKTKTVLEILEKCKKKPQ